MQTLFQTNLIHLQTQKIMKTVAIQTMLFLFLLILAASCAKEEHAFMPLTGPNASTTGPDGQQLKTRQDTLDLIASESLKREVHTDYLNEGLNLDARISGSKKILLPNPLTGKVSEMDAQIIDGELVVEGDMVIGRAAKYRASLEKGVAINDFSRRWEYGIIPYVIQSGHGKINDIQAAIDRVSAETHLTMKPRTNEEDYVFFAISTKLNSAVGRQGGAQTINISSGASTGNVIHEIFHAAGMWHEQSRCDRDNHLDVHWGNIKDGYAHNFNKHCSDGIDMSNYNYGSIMHYGPKFFSKNSDPTIMPKMKSDIFTWLNNYFAMGQRNEISNTDRWTIAYMYPVVPNGTYALYPEHSRKPILATGKKGEIMVQWEDNQNLYDYQRLQFIPSSDGYYYIKHKKSGKYLDIEGASGSKGARLLLWDFHGGNNQQFKIEFVSASVYRIRPRHINRYLDIRGVSYANGAAVHIWDHTGAGNQHFLIIPR